MAATPIPNQVLASGTTSLNLDLSSHFGTDSITGSLVKLTTNLKGKSNALFLELFDAPNPAAARTTPLTAANFLSYVNNGAYNGTVFHRLVPGFVLQGGGFRLPSASASPPVPIAQGPTVLNEPGNGNLRGTVAMAKLGNDPNSATNQFFFNLANNTANLDRQNGGFTVFGQLVRSSLALLDRLAATSVFNAAEVFSELPLQRYKPAKPGARPRPVIPANFLAITTAEQSGAFSFKVKAKGANARVDPISGALDLRWNSPPTKATSVSVTATSVINPRERYSTSFQVLPAPLNAIQPQAFAPATSADPLAGLVGLTDLLAG